MGRGITEPKRNVIRGLAWERRQDQRPKISKEMTDGYIAAGGTAGLERVRRWEEVGWGCV